jgi:Fic family protein
MNNIKIMDLLKQKKILQDKLSSIVYGTIEIREEDSNKYIYVHEKVNGVSHTKYVGLYSQELANVILNNSLEARMIKKNIKRVNKELEELGYNDILLTQKVKNNIDFAKKNLVATIYKQAILEGVATTYADTEDIIDGAIINNMKPQDIHKISNLKQAWDFILEENVIGSPTDYYLLCQINKLILDGFYYNAGELRNTPVNIGGTVWKPDFPIESDIKEEINAILNKQENNVDKAIDLLLYVTKKQMFIDGNKRASVIFANHYLISKGLGIIVIPEEKVEQYKELLIFYYENKNIDKIKTFLKEECYIKI